jgi:DNA processing protein
LFLDEINDHQKIAWMHAVMVLSKKIAVGSAKANDDFRRQLLEAGSVRNLYDYYFSMIPVDDVIAKKVFEKIKKFDSPFISLSIFDEDYPQSLSDFPGTPPVIYVQGDPVLLKSSKSIAFVGTRQLDQDSHIDHGERVVKRLIRSGYSTIVSGLAEGSDTLGHLAAIKYGGRTIAVLGTPIDMYYPKSNMSLQKSIAKNNLVVSEYPIGLGSFGSFFANRNRTTVALSSDGVVVARAGDKSGTQYAVRICLEQGKQLYVLENNIREPSYTWVVKYREKMKIIRESFDAGDNI